MESSLAGAQEAQETLKDDIKQLNTEKSGMLEEVAAGKDALAGKAREVDAAKGDADRLRSEVEHLQRELAREEARAAELEKDLAAAEKISEAKRRDVLQVIRRVKIRMKRVGK